MPCSDCLQPVSLAQKNKHKSLECKYRRKLRQTCALCLEQFSQNHVCKSSILPCDAHKTQILEPVNKLVDCSLCRGLLNRGVQCAFCFHLMCQTCLNPRLIFTQECPICYTPNTNFVSVPRNVQRMLDLLKVTCSKCQMQVPYLEFDTH